MENKERDNLIGSIYKQIDDIKSKLYNIVWEEPTTKNTFDSLPKAERIALIGLLNDACKFKESLAMYTSWFSRR